MEPNNIAAVRVSVVIVSYHRVEQLRQSLTALHQPGSQIQVVVVDNGSRDGAASLADEFPDVRFSRLPRNFGLTRALNIGIRASDGEYILLLHDDVQIDATSVTALAEFLENRPDVAAVCPHLNSPQLRALPTPSNPDPAFETPADGEEVVAECVSGAAIMVRTSFLRSMGHIDERYGNYGSAIEICAQIRSSNRKLVILSGVTAIHGSTPSPMPKGSIKSDRAAGTAAFIGKHHGFGAGLLYRLKNSPFGATKIDGSG